MAGSVRTSSGTRAVWQWSQRAAPPLSSKPGARPAVFFVCDIQERFRPLIHGFGDVLHTAKTLCRAADIFGSGLLATEQYPKAFGHTVPELQDWFHPAVLDGDSTTVPGAITDRARLDLGDGTGPRSPVFSKLQFAMWTPGVAEYVAQLSRHPSFGTPQTIVLCGIEAHVCVLHTCQTMLHEGKEVIVVADGVSSQRVGDRRHALGMMERMGAAVMTLESTLLHLCGSASAPVFKDVSKLLKDHNARQSKLLELV